MPFEQTETARAMQRRYHAEGEAKGEMHAMRTAILAVVRARWSATPDDVVARLLTIDDPARLSTLIGEAVKVPDLATFAALLD